MFLTRRLKTEHRKPRPANRFRPALESLDERCLPSGGVFDPTFDADGVVTTLLGNGNRATAVTTAPHGKLLMAGYAYTKTGTTNFALTRYKADGSLDTTFGSGGSVNAQPGKGFTVAIQPDGKILVAGRSGDDFAILRYSSSGTLDRTFGRNGVATIDIAARSVDDGRAMVLQPDGKIVVAGTTRAANATDCSIAVVRLTASGALDTSFGNGGKVVRAPSTGTLTPFTPEDRGEGLALDLGTNKLVVAGSLYTGGTVVFRFNANGTSDPSFDGDGEVMLASLNRTASIAVQADHKVVVAGMHDDLSGTDAGWDFGMFRLNPDGTGDAGFGAAGLVYTPEPTANTPVDVEIQTDGQIVLFGYHDNTEPMLARYRGTDGSLDTSFGSNGFAIGSGMGPMYCTDMTLDAAGRIVIAGGSSGGPVYALVARFLATGPTIASFTPSSPTVTAGDPVTLTTSGVTAQNPGSTVTQVAIYADANGDGKLDARDTLLGYATQAAPGTWTLTVSTAGWTTGNHKLFAQATDSLGALGDAVALTITII
jgi:uncharacterized delta-60 repeat protein